MKSPRTQGKAVATKRQSLIRGISDFLTKVMFIMFDKRSLIAGSLPSEFLAPKFVHCTQKLFLTSNCFAADETEGGTQTRWFGFALRTPANS